MSGRIKYGTAGLALILMLGVMPPSALGACTVSADPVSFGVYDPANGTALDTAGNVQVVCSFLIGVLVSYNISLNAGTGSGGSYAPRQMVSGGNTLNYNLYSNAARTVVWGDGTGGTSTVSDGYTIVILGSVTRNYTVYGRIPAQQNVAAGAYADTITVTVNY